MYQLKRSANTECENLMRELAMIEQKLMAENSALAMDLMVVEAKIRERFQRLERLSPVSEPNAGPGLSLDDLQALIPRDLPAFPTVTELKAHNTRRRMWETVSTAAALAVFTALGVFGLASVLQLALTWLA